MFPCHYFCMSSAIQQLDIFKVFAVLSLIQKPYSLQPLGTGFIHRMGQPVLKKIVIMSFFFSKLKQPLRLRARHLYKPQSTAVFDFSTQGILCQCIMVSYASCTAQCNKLCCLGPLCMLATHKRRPLTSPATPTSQDTLCLSPSHLRKNVPPFRLGIKG